MTDLHANSQHAEAKEETEDDIISEEELNKRRKYLEDLKSFLNEQQEKISLTLEQLGWTPEHFIKPQNKVTCPFNPNHVLPESKLDKHIETCQWLSKGVPRYQLKDVLDEKDRLKNIPMPTIKLDECKLNGILWNKAVKSGQVYTGQRKLPVTPEDDTIILTPDERLAVHEYIVSEAQSKGIMMNVEKDEHLTIDWQKVIKKGVLESETSDKLTPLEKMQALRDFKRRRQKYRAKNVHITRKSYTEIIREVISNQVEMWGAEEGENEEENEGEIEMVDAMETGQDSGYFNRESRGSLDSSGFGRDSGRGWSDRDRNDRGRDRESDRRGYRDDRDRGFSRGQSRETSRENYRDSRRGPYRESSHRDQSRESYRESSRDQSRESYRERGDERRGRDYSRERSKKRDRVGSRDRSRSSDRRPPKKEKYEMSQMKSEKETTPMVECKREDSRSKTSQRDSYKEDYSSRSHKKSKKHKHKKKHKKHKERRKSSSSSDSESPT